jgi:uncharacterized protein
VITRLHDVGYMGFTASLLDDSEYGGAIRRLVKSADFGIETIVRQNVKDERTPTSLPKNRARSLHKLEMRNSEGASTIMSRHRRYSLKDKHAGFVELDFTHEESDGTQQFLALAGPFLHALREGTVLVVDEFDTHLHPVLTKRLVGLFNTSANRKNAQLVFVTHDQGLLNSRIIRRDQIWFAEKGPFGASDLFRLSQISGVRKDANIEKEYLLGQFGGVPAPGDFQKIVL